MNAVEIKDKILSNEYKICNKRGRSKIWDCFGFIKNTDDIEIPDFVACKMCKNVYKYNKNRQSNLNKHKCCELLRKNYESELVELDQESKRSCTDVLTEWIIKSARPYSLVQDKGLRTYSNLMLSFGKKFGTNIDLESLIAHPTTIERNVKNSFAISFEKLKSEMACVKKLGYALTCDLWTENYSKITYLALTAHYIMDSQCKSKLLGVKSMKGISNTSFNIKYKLETLLSDFNCSLNDPTVIVTDRGSNIRAALKDHANINCINHLIHNTVEKCIKSSEIISEIVATSSNLVKFVKKSGLNCSLNTSLKSFTPTRWNTVYFTLWSIKSNFVDIQNIITERKLIDKYGIIKEYYLDQLIEILKPFASASNELEGCSYATIHLVHPHIRRLKTVCSSSQNDEPNFITDFKKNLHDTLTSLVESHITIYHKLAIFLFPPANQLKQFNPEERTEITNECQSLLLSYANEISIIDSQPEPSPSKIYSLFENYIEPIEKTSSNESVIENEITKYKNTQVLLQSDFDVLKWWHERKNEFPLLYKLSCRIFAIPASSAPSERVFSVARALITDKRSKVVCNEKSFNDILFVNINSEE